MDEFLSKKKQATIYDFLQEEIFLSAHLRARRTAIREWDGDSRVGPAITSRRDSSESEMVLPTSTPYDDFADRMKEYMGTQFGREFLSNGRSFGFRAYRYTPNAGLTWHTDGPFEASFIYYVHPEWRAHWGGMLLIGQGTYPRDGSSVNVTHLYRNADYDVYSRGEFIAPIPNRLVVLRKGTPHCITPVTPAAGDRHRLSLAGYVRGAE